MSEYPYDEVLVGLTPEIKTKQIDKNLFPEVEIIEIVQLSMSSSPDRKTRTVLLLKLATSTRQELLETIMLLQKNPHVEYAEPNHTYIFDICG